MSESVPPRILTVPPMAAPRRLATLIPTLSKASVAPDWTLKTVFSIAEETKALPLREYFNEPPLTVIAPKEPSASCAVSNVIVPAPTLVSRL